MHRLDTGRTLLAAADGMRTSVATALLPERADRRHRRRGLARRGAARKSRPLATIRRARPLVSDARLRGEPSVARAGTSCASRSSCREPVRLRAASSRSCSSPARCCSPGTRCKHRHRSARGRARNGCNLWAQPLVYRDRAPPRRRISGERRRRRDVLGDGPPLHARVARAILDFVSVYFIQDYESWFYPADRTGCIAATSLQLYALTDHHIVKSRWLADMVDRHGARARSCRSGLDLGVFYRRSSAVGRGRGCVSVAAPQRRCAAADFQKRSRHSGASTRRGPTWSSCSSAPRHGHAEAAVPVSRTPDGCTIRTRWRRSSRRRTFVLDASLWQGFGRPGLEAMACGDGAGADECRRTDASTRAMARIACSCRPVTRRPRPLRSFVSSTTRLADAAVCEPVSTTARAFSHDRRGPATPRALHAMGGRGASGDGYTVTTVDERRIGGTVRILIAQNPHSPVRRIHANRIAPIAVPIARHG